MLFDKIVDRIIRVVEFITMILMGCSILIIVLQIFFRYVLKSPLIWSEQTARYLFIWTMSLGIPIVFYRKTVIGFDLLLNKFPDGLRFAVGILIKLITLGFSVFYFIASVSLCRKTSNSMTSGVQIPFIVLYIAMPICATLIGLVMIDFIILDISARRKGTKEECK